MVSKINCITEAEGAIDDVYSTEQAIKDGNVSRQDVETIVDDEALMFVEDVYLPQAHSEHKAEFDDRFVNHQAKTKILIID